MALGGRYEVALGDWLSFEEVAVFGGPHGFQLNTTYPASRRYSTHAFGICTFGIKRIRTQFGKLGLD